MEKFDFLKEEYEYIKEQLMLDEDDDLAKVLKMKIKGYTITKMALELHLSERTINRRVKKLKKMIKRVI